MRAIVPQPDLLPDTEFDYIVVGSGAGGGPVAANLALAGYRVLLLKPAAKPKTRITPSPPFIPSRLKTRTSNGTISSGITRTTTAKTTIPSETRTVRASGIQEPARWEAARHTMP